jgi:hypothetical protein
MGNRYVAAATLANELMQGVSIDAREDHEAIAEALRRGDTAQEILGMAELDRWPETYSWLRNEIRPAAAAAIENVDGGFMQFDTWQDLETWQAQA